MREEARVFRGVCNRETSQRWAQAYTLPPSKDRVLTLMTEETDEPASPRLAPLPLCGICGEAEVGDGAREQGAAARGK